MKYLMLSVIFILLFINSAISGSLDPSVVTRVRNLTLEGLESAYNLDLVKANKLFDEAITTEPLHPRPYISKSTIYLWRYLMGMKTADYDAFLSSAEKAINVCEEYMGRYGEDPDVLICLGTVYGYRSFVYGRSKSYLKSAWDGKKSFDYFNNALAMDPKAYDAYLGLGVYHYVSAFLPKTLQWIASILGVKGDGELALKELRLAAEKGTYAKTEAKYYIAQFLPWQNGDFDSSEKIFADLSKQYPSNSLLTFTLAVWEIRRNDVRSAKEKLESIIKEKNSAIEGVNQFAQYKLAECYFRLNEFDRSREAYAAFLEHHDDETYVATSNYRIGICYELTGKREGAIPFYKKAFDAESKFGDDSYSSRKASMRIKNPLTEEAKFLLYGQNALRSGNTDEAGRNFLNVIQKTPSPDMRAEAIYGFGETLFEQKKYSEALEQFGNVLRMSIRSEQWLLPWSEYQSGLCQVKLGGIAEAKKHFEKVDEYDDYDFKNWLGFRAERELAKLKK